MDRAAAHMSEAESAMLESAHAGGTSESEPAGLVAMFQKIQRRTLHWEKRPLKTSKRNPAEAGPV
jgi:hypothetical protein